TVLGAVAELERSLIAERVRAGLRNARAKGKRLGRPRVIVDRARIDHLRAQGLSWVKIAELLGVGEGTVYRLGRASAKNPVETAPLCSFFLAAVGVFSRPTKSCDFAAPTKRILLEAVVGGALRFVASPQAAT